MHKAATERYPGAGASSAGATFQQSMPLLFVLIWATGFIVARLVAPHAEPLTFLTLRYLLSIAVFSAIACAVGATWPQTGQDWRLAFFLFGERLSPVQIVGMVLAAAGVAIASRPQ